MLNNDHKFKRPLLLGGGGFIGSHLTAEMGRLGFDPIVVDRNSIPNFKGTFIQSELDSESHLQDLIDLRSVDIVYLLAWSSRPGDADLNPIQDLSRNVVSNLAWIEAIHQANPTCRIVFISTGGAIYGHGNSYPHKESDTLKPLGMYGYGKSVVESYLELCSRRSNLDYLVFRPANPYGPGQIPGTGQGIVATFLYKISRGLPIQVWGDGTIVRDYLYIDDLIAGLISAMKFELMDKRVFNLGAGHGYSINQLIVEMQNLVNEKIDVIYSDGRPVDVDQVVLDCSLASEHLNWSVKTSMSQGLFKTFDWIKSLP